MTTASTMRPLKFTRASLGASFWLELEAPSTDSHPIWPLSSERFAAVGSRLSGIRQLIPRLQRDQASRWHVLDAGSATGQARR